MLFSLWVKEPSEFNRAEVVYDALLPWLAGRFLPAALEETRDDAFAQWRTPSRAGGDWKCVAEAVRYCLAAQGVSEPELKQLFFAMRH